MGVDTTNSDYFNFIHYSTLQGYAFNILPILYKFRVDLYIFLVITFLLLLVLSHPFLNFFYVILAQGPC